MNITTIKMQELKETLEIPWFHLEEFKEELILEISIELMKVYQQYPFLKGKIQALGSNEDILKLMQEKLPKEKISFALNYCMSVGFIKKENLLFIGLGIHPALNKQNIAFWNEEIRKKSEEGFFTKHCQNLRDIIWHEVGHILDYQISFWKNPNFLSLLKKVDGNYIELAVSKYALTDVHEFIAECFLEANKGCGNEFCDLVTNTLIQEYTLVLKKKGM